MTAAAAPVMVLSAVLSAPCAVAAAPSNIHVVDMGTLGGATTVVYDINQQGAATGYSTTSAGQIHAFIYQHGAISDIGTLGGKGSLGTAINDAGQVTGFALTAAGEVHAFLYGNGSMTDLGETGSNSSGNTLNNAGQVAGEVTPVGGTARAALFIAGTQRIFATSGSTSTADFINEQGLVTGIYTDTMGTHVFLDSSKGSSFVDVMPGVATFLAGSRVLSASGALAGNYKPGGINHGFIYAGGKATDIGSLGGGYTVATAINRTGKITGLSAGLDGQRHAFLYNGTTLQDLGTLGGDLSVAYGLNDDDQVTGESTTSVGQLHAFVSQNGALLDLGELVNGLVTGSDVTESKGIGINTSGQVIGLYYISTPTDLQSPLRTRSFIANTGQSSLPVTQLFQALVTAVAGVGPGGSLLAKVESALTKYLVGDIRGSCFSLGALINEVDAQTGKKIDPQIAAQLLQDTNALQAAMGC